MYLFVMFNNFDERSRWWIFGANFAAVIVFFELWMGCVVMSADSASSSLVDFYTNLTSLKFLLFVKMGLNKIFRSLKFCLKNFLTFVTTEIFLVGFNCITPYFSSYLKCIIIIL